MLYITQTVDHILYTQTGDINDIWVHCYKLFIEVIDRHTPLKKKVVRGITVSWVTPKIIQDANTRNRLHRKFTENKTSKNCETYRKQRNFVTSSKRSAFKSYCIDASTNSGHPEKFWKKFYCLLPSKLVTKLNVRLQGSDYSCYKSWCYCCLKVTSCHETVGNRLKPFDLKKTITQR